jgi:hypothetical protein
MSWSIRLAEALSSIMHAVGSLPDAADKASILLEKLEKRIPTVNFVLTAIKKTHLKWRKVAIAIAIYGLRSLITCQIGLFIFKAQRTADA